MKRLQIGLQREDQIELMQIMDPSLSGRVDYFEFLTALSTIHAEESKAGHHQDGAVEDDHYYALGLHKANFTLDRCIGGGGSGGTPTDGRDSSVRTYGVDGRQYIIDKQSLSRNEYVDSDALRRTSNLSGTPASFIAKTL